MAPDGDWRKSATRRYHLDVIDDPTDTYEGGPSACPFVAFEDDRDHRSSSPDFRHRCFAAPEPEPRAFPHQERYCLTAGFTACPVFLDWARQEVAAVKAAGAGAGNAAGADAAAAAIGAEPAFLAARPRTISTPDAAAATRHSDGSSTLWTYDGETKRSQAPAPTPPSSLGIPAVAMARRGPSHPGWENPPRVESFPRLRNREDHRANSPLLFVAVGVALVFVALILFPIITSNHGGGTVGNGSPSAAVSVHPGSPAPSDSAAPEGSPGTSFQTYIVQPGDYMAKIALKFNLQLGELELANPQITDPAHIEVGDILHIPPAGLLTPPPPSPSAS